MNALVKVRFKLKIDAVEGFTRPGGPDGAHR